MLVIGKVEIADGHHIVVHVGGHNITVTERDLITITADNPLAPQP